MEPLSHYRGLFPACEDSVYLNHAGVAPTSTRVRAASLEWLDELVRRGIRGEESWEARAEQVRALAARLVGSSPAEIAFVRNTSHGLGLVAEGIDWKAGDEVAVASEIEYPSNVYPWLHLAARGVTVRPIPAVRGGVTPEGLREALSSRTRVVAVSSVQYATGHATDLAAISRLCRAAGALLVVDAIQSVGAFPLDVELAGVDVLSADSHKWMLGVNGIGFLHVRREILDRIRPVLVGWKSTTGAWDFDRARFELREDASKFEEGSPSYLGIYALGAAIELLLEVGVERIAARIRELLGRLERSLAGLPVRVSPDARERAGILTIRFEDSRAEREAFDALTTRGFTLSLRRGALRVSPHFYTTDEEIDRLAGAISAILARR